jgi:hypothetical protein
MRIPDKLRECACFVQAQWPSGRAGIGTAFFVAVPLGIEDHWFHYVVTARHCITGRQETQKQEGGSAETAVLWVNHSRGGRAKPRTRVSEWLLHETADVAVFPLGGLDPGYQVTVWPLNESVATEEVVREKNIGAGDDIFITGLLVHHPGKTRNLPIVRLGSIAAMPDDPIMLETGDDIVTLVEMHSIGGLSGSPVFAHLSDFRDMKGGFAMWAERKAHSGGTSWLYGVMHGFYPVGPNDPDNVSGGNENLNTGIAIVARIDRVLDLIHRPDQVAMRAEVKKRIEDEKAVIPIPTSGEGARPEEFERFEALTRDLLRVPKTELE